MSDLVVVKKEDFLSVAFSYLDEVDVLLDIGCGIVPHDYIRPVIYICCEPYEEYVDVLKEKVKSKLDSIYIIHNLDWEETIQRFADKSVDTVFLIDVIEHLHKEEGERLLQLTERVVRRQIVIFTPSEYIEQKTLPGNKDAWGLSGLDWQEHKSIWNPLDFDNKWTCIWCKDFHEYNNIGELLRAPVGAFFAIKSFSDGDDIQYSEDVMLEELKNGFKKLRKCFEAEQENKKILNKAYEQLQQKYQALHNEYSNARSELLNIYGSKGWKVLLYCYKIKKIFKGG